MLCCGTLPEELVDGVVKYCRNNEGEMVDLLGKLASIDSGSYYAEGVNEVGAIVSAWLRQAGFEVNSIEAGDHGKMVFGSTPGRKKRRLFVMGHMDTVYPRGTVSWRSFRREESRVFGPGVCDAKGGLVTGIYALSALHHLGWNEAALSVLFNSHEEVGSKFARRMIETEAAKSFMVFNLEASRPNGELVTGRKGVAFLTVTCKGKSAHAGVEPEKGVNAIEAIAHKVLALQKMNDPSRGITVNVGMIHGGAVSNVVPDRAEARVDVRFENHEDLQPFFDEAEQEVAKLSVRRATCGVNWEVLFVPLKRSPGVIEAYELVKKAAGLIGMKASESFTGGGSDAGFAAAVGARTICGMGPVGGNSHGDGEYVETRSLQERASLLALSLALAARAE